MIHSLGRKATSGQIHEMLEVYPTLIKIVVDVRRRVLAGGGEMHADCESLLLAEGSGRMTSGGPTGIRLNSAWSLSRSSIFGLASAIAASSSRVKACVVT